MCTIFYIAPCFSVIILQSSGSHPPRATQHTSWDPIWIKEKQMFVNKEWTDMYKF